MIAICSDCKHFINKGEKDRETIWYNLYCGATKREVGIDPVTGTKSYVGKNDLGRKYFTDEKYHHCKDINKNGTCNKFILVGTSDGKEKSDSLNRIFQMVAKES